jgi:pimeloyl-ACP methyl ester carboxylesterase
MIQIVVVVGSLLAVLLLAGLVFEWVTERRDARHFAPPGRIVGAGSRNLHLLCQGDGAGPTIVIEQGAGSPSIFWWPVQRTLAKSVRVCTYDRAGYLWSAPAGQGRSITARVDDLHDLLVGSGLPGPFVLVGYSYGGLLIGQLARRFPELIAGVVFVDAPDEPVLYGSQYLAQSRQLLRIVAAMAFAARFGALRLFNPMLAQLPPEFSAADLRALKSLAAHPCFLSAMLDDFGSLQRASAQERQAAAPGSLGDIPVSVITHGTPYPAPYDALNEGWNEGQARLAALSSNSEIVIAAGNGHMIQFDQPGVVIDAIARVHAAARDGTRLGHGGMDVAAG